MACAVWVWGVTSTLASIRASPGMPTERELAQPSCLWFGVGYEGAPRGNSKADLLRRSCSTFAPAAGVSGDLSNKLTLRWTAPTDSLP